MDAACAELKEESYNLLHETWLLEDILSSLTSCSLEQYTVFCMYLCSLMHTFQGVRIAVCYAYGRIWLCAFLTKESSSL